MPIDLFVDELDPNELLVITSADSSPRLWVTNQVRACVGRERSALINRSPVSRVLPPPAPPCFAKTATSVGRSEMDQAPDPLQRWQVPRIRRLEHVLIPQ